MTAKCRTRRLPSLLGQKGDEQCVEFIPPLHHGEVPHFGPFVVLHIWEPAPPLLRAIDWHSLILGQDGAHSVLQ